MQNVSPEGSTPAAQSQASRFVHAANVCSEHYALAN